ncbi:hypothetical protein BSKO_09034 [Bryopsis sp. KO-2023]|nr:hypothetical protein BSKO_09034 [Bryopsis sp. KO-2023]
MRHNWAPVDALIAVGAGSLALGGSISCAFLWRHFLSTFKLKPQKLEGKGVVVTGCDSGIGRATVEHLSKQWPQLVVFAGCLTKEGAARLSDEAALEGRDNLITFVVDVTDESSVANATKLVSSNLGGANLHAVINNAGIYDGFYSELTPLRSFKRVMDVNFFGAVSVSKAFLPMLVRSGGRLINVGSVASIFSTPSNATYAASKHALRAFSEALRSEVGYQGVEVIQIFASAVQTDALANITRSYVKLAMEADPEIVSRYGGTDHAKSFAALMKDYLKGACEASVIAKCIERTLMSAFPKAVYYAGPGSRVTIPFSMTPTFFKDAFFGNPVKSVDKVVVVKEES